MELNIYIVNLSTSDRIMQYYAYIQYVMQLLYIYMWYVWLRIYRYMEIHK